MVPRIFRNCLELAETERRVLNSFDTVKDHVIQSVCLRALYLSLSRMYAGWCTHITLPRRSIHNAIQKGKFINRPILCGPRPINFRYRSHLSRQTSGRTKENNRW